MATVLEYCRKLSDEQLLDVVDDYIKSGNPILVDTALAILDILEERHPHEFDAQAAWRRFQEQYMPKEKTSEA